MQLGSLASRKYIYGQQVEKRHTFRYLIPGNEREGRNRRWAGFSMDSELFGVVKNDAQCRASSGA
jgi:hypothetical protein